MALNATVHPLQVELKNRAKRVENKLDFGSVLVNDQLHERVIVSNMSPCLPITIQIDKMSNFAAHPSQFTIVPGGQEIVSVMFTPRQGLGRSMF